MDIEVSQHSATVSLMRQSLRTRDSFQDPYACFAESMVCSHVIVVHMMAYALWCCGGQVSVSASSLRKAMTLRKEMEITDNLTYVGLSFMTLGGFRWCPLWAKAAYGDITGHGTLKETWAPPLWLSPIWFMYTIVSTVRATFVLRCGC